MLAYGYMLDLSVLSTKYSLFGIANTEELTEAVCIRLNPKARQKDSAQGAHIVHGIGIRML